MDEYVREFVQESEEEITELNNALLTLEQNPDDGEAMDLIFRTAHTLKGNAGAMGFDRAEALAHVLEDLLDAVRRGDIEVSAELMDRIFDSVDRLGEMIDEVPEHGSPQTDPAETISMLREQLEVADALSTPTDGEIDRLLRESASPADAQHNQFHVRLDVAEEREQHGMLVVEALEDAFDLLGTAPPEDEISDGEYGGSFDAVFASAVGEESIAAALDPVDAVENVVIEDVTGRTVAEPADETDSTSGSPIEEDADPDDMEVDDLLDEFSEYDDLDGMVEEIEDVEGFDDLGDAGSFDDIEVGEIEAIDDPEEPDTSDVADVEAEADATEPADEVEDASDTFKELKAEVDPVGFDELQAELDELEFEELDDDEVSFDELLDEDDLGGDDPFAAGEFDDDDPFGAGDESDEPGVDELLDEVEDQPAGENDDPMADVDEPAVGTDEPAADVDEPAVEAEAPAGEEKSASAGLDDADSDIDDVVSEVEAGDVEAEAGDVEVEADDAEMAADEAETAEAEVDADDETSKASPDDMGSLDDEELFAEDEADGPVAEEAGLDDVEVRDVDDSGKSPDLDLEDPFAAPSPDTESEPAATLDEEDDAEPAADVGTDKTDVSEAGSFGDIDFGGPADPEAEPGELDDGGFGSADELDLSMDLEEAEDEPGDAEADSADASATAPETTAEPEQSSETAADTDGSATAETSVSTEPSDEAVEASVESVDLESDADAEEGPPTEITEAVKADDATADYSQPSAAAGTAVDTETVQSVRVDVDQVDQLMNLVEGLVSTRARLRRAVDAEESRRVIDSEVDELDALTSELQDTVMDVRLVPLQKVVNKLPRLVRDISRDQDKRVTLDMEGEDVEVDRSILDEIGDPLMHIVRNAIDHGIEPPEEREDAGKDPGGTIELSAWRERDHVVIEIEDDGRGIDADELGDSAVEQGIIGRDDLLAMEESDIYELVFHPGFSTSEEVTDVSGRGVGMDVVASTVESLDGDVGIESDPGEGTTVRVEVPISLAIADVLFVESGGEEYGIPTRVVSEIGPSGSVSVEDGREVVTRGETSYPLIRLDEALDTPERGQNGDGMLVQVRDDVRPVAVHCDRVRGQQEVVVKPFEGFIGNIPGLSGATVLGEGDVVNILDVETL